MNTASKDFGRRLRLARERAGVSLEAIAAATKIKRSLLADLERGDASKWPPGIYRRAFVREYAGAIGFSADAAVSEFLELFPEEGAPVPLKSDSQGLRLTLADEPDQARLATVRQLATTALEACGVVLLAWAVARLTGSDFWPVCAVVALTYYPLAALALVFPSPAGKPTVTTSGPRDRVPSARDLIQSLLHRTPVQSADERPA